MEKEDMNPTTPVVKSDTPRAIDDENEVLLDDDELHGEEDE